MSEFSARIITRTWTRLARNANTQSRISIISIHTTLTMCSISKVTTIHTSTGALLTYRSMSITLTRTAFWEIPENKGD
uniref:Candidate secreted effector n=1 Tax=Meloidogyne incognita TaxID=6306 RepID=A0A914N589_MELIC